MWAAPCNRAVQPRIFFFFDAVQVDGIPIIMLTRVQRKKAPWVQLNKEVMEFILKLMRRYGPERQRTNPTAWA